MFPIILFAAVVAMALPISVGVASAESVTIGVPLPLSGNLKAFGTMMKNSFEMAQTAINEAGGINGNPLEIVFADDQGKVEAAKTAFDQLVAANPVMLVGGYASDPTYQMAKLAENKDLPFLICTASADKITQNGWDNIYRRSANIPRVWKTFWSIESNPNPWRLYTKTACSGPMGLIVWPNFVPIRPSRYGPRSVMIK